MGAPELPLLPVGQEEGGGGVASPHQSSVRSTDTVTAETDTSDSRPPPPPNRVSQPLQGDPDQSRDLSKADWLIGKEQLALHHPSLS